MDRINYRRIFTDVRTNEDHLFVRVTVYCSDSYNAPIIMEIERGNTGLEDCNHSWSIMEQKQQADSIRYAIQIIDSYDFEKAEV